MRFVTMVILSIIFLLPFQMFAENITFPSGSISFTENGHSFTVSGDGQMYSSSYRSASWCLLLNSNYGANWYLTKNGGNKFQLNSLWINNLQGYSYSIQFKGYDGASQKYTKDVTINTGGYQQVTFSSWTDITKIQGIAPGASSGWVCDDIDYTVNNSAPTNIAINDSYIDDGDPSGTTVGTFNTDDQDDSGSHTYTFAAGGADNASFTIDGSDLKTAFTADYDTKNSYAIKIRSTDDGGLYYEGNLTITVNPDAPSCYIVSGAENSNYNGTYNRDGNSNNYPQYRMGSYYLENRGCGTTWGLSAGGALECPVYSIDSSTDLPPSSGYVQGSIGSGDDVASNVVITNGDATLPVELSAFSAAVENGTVVVSWTTQSEVDHLGFILQRTNEKDLNKENWQTIESYKVNTSLKGSGDIRESKNYKVNDQAVESDTQYFYRLISVALDGTFEYSHSISVETGIAVPVEFALHSAFPNPFNPETTLIFDLAQACDVSLVVSDITGKQVRTLLYRFMSEGSHKVKWDGLDHQGNRAASGVYFVTLKTSMGHRLTEKIMMLK